MTTCILVKSHSTRKDYLKLVPTQRSLLDAVAAIPQLISLFLYATPKLHKACCHSCLPNICLWSSNAVRLYGKRNNQDKKFAVKNLSKQHSVPSIWQTTILRTYSKLRVRLVHRRLIVGNAYRQAGDNIFCRSCFLIHPWNNFFYFFVDDHRLLIIDR